jgi:hypothetical protein
MPSIGTESTSFASDEAATLAAASSSDGGLVSWPARFLHLFALGGLAIAQPLLGLLGGEPQFWIARDASYFDVAVVIFLATLLVPLLAFGIERLIAMASKAVAWWFHLVVIFALGAVFAVYAIETLTDSGVPLGILLLAAALVSGLLTFSYQRFDGVRGFVGILAIAPLALSALLVFNLPPLGGSTAETIPVGIDSDASVVMVVFDEFQIASILNDRGEIDHSRYPNLGRLADASVWYRNATTVHDNTLNSVPAILTGLMPDGEQEGVVEDYPQNLFTMLGSTHTMRVNENVTQLCPTNLCDDPEPLSNSDGAATLITDTTIVYLHSVTPDVLRYRLPPIGTRWAGFLQGDRSQEVDETSGLGQEATSLAQSTEGEERAVQFGAFLDSFDPSLGPTLYYLHVDVPHAPWAFMPSGHRYGYSDHIPGQSPEGFWLDDPWYAQQAYQRYLLHLGFVDDLTGRMLDRLEQLGMLDEVMIVVVSDHGENFEAGEPRRALRDDTLAAIAGIPLFVKYPDQKQGSSDDRNAQSVDVVPTIIDALGGTVPSVDGVVLAAAPHEGTKHLIGNDGYERNLSLADYEILAAEQIEFNESQFRTSAGFEPVYLEAGPRPDLVGRQTEDFEILDAAGSISLPMSGAYGVVDFDSAWIPIAVPASIESRDRDLPTVFAVAVNGTIWSTITAHESSSRAATIYAIVPPESFVAGSNVVDVYGIAEGADNGALIRFA